MPRDRGLPLHAAGRPVDMPGILLVGRVRRRIVRHRFQWRHGLSIFIDHREVIIFSPRRQQRDHHRPEQFQRRWDVQGLGCRLQFLLGVLQWRMRQWDVRHVLREWVPELPRGVGVL